MALSERSRTTIYQTFEPLLGDEVVSDMLSYFPARDLEEPITKEFLRAELAEFRSELRGEMADFKAETGGEIIKLRGEMATGFEKMAKEFHQDQVVFMRLLIGSQFVLAVLFALSQAFV